jgi:hypothetical protein
MRFCAFKPKHALFFVFPRKRESRSGTIRLIAFPLSFAAVFPFARLWIPAFAGMTKGGKSRESWAEVREKGATPNRDRKFGPISELTEVWKRLYSIELTKMSSPLFAHKFF